MSYLALFRMPKPMKITGRSSSITNSFINSIIPVIPPTEKQVKEALTILGMDLDNFECIYCGSTASEWDHLRPLVHHKKPTGFISEIHNLVPSCGKCNQSKGNQLWETWILGDATLSPKTRGIADLQRRIEALRKYEAWQKPTQIDFETIVGKEKWNQHWRNWEIVQETMRHAQVLATEINQTVAKAYAESSHD